MKWRQSTTGDIARGIKEENASNIHATYRPLVAPGEPLGDAAMQAESALTMPATVCLACARALYYCGLISECSAIKAGSLRTALVNRRSLVYALAVVPLILLFAFDLMSRRGDLSCLAALRLTCVELINSGKAPYLDFFDWSQPLAYDLFQLPGFFHRLLLSAGLPLRLEDVCEGLVVLAVTASSLVTYLALSLGAARTGDEGAREDISCAILPFALTPVLLAFFARFQLGELQFLMALSVLPWLASRWLAYLDIKLPGWLTVCTAVTAGLTLATETPYWLLAVAIEGALFAVYRAPRALFTPATVALICGLLSGLLRVATLPQAVQKAYWEWIMPLRQLQFGELDEMIQGPGSAPEQAYVFYFYLAAVALALILARKQKIISVAAALATCGLAFFLMEKQGYTRDIVLAMGGIILVLALALSTPLKSLRARPIVSALPLLLCAAGYVAWYTHAIELDYSEGINPHPRATILGASDINVVIQDNSQNGDAVAVLCDYPDPAYPLLFNLHREPGNYLLFARPLRLLMRLQARGLKVGHWQEFEDHLLTRVRGDFESRRAALVLVHGAYVREYLEQKGLFADLEKNYSESTKAAFLSDNRQPREFLGYYFGFDTFVSPDREGKK